MRTILRVSLSLLFLFAMTACTSDKDVSESKEVEGKGNTMEETIPAAEFPDQFLSGNYEVLYNQLSKSFQKEVSFEEFKRIGEQFNSGVKGFSLTSQLNSPGVVEYQWVSEEGKKGIRANFTEDHTIVGLQVLNITANLEADADYTKNTYQMPINEPWFTFWGGVNELVNYHYPYDNQRYAYDLIIKDGESNFEGDPEDNESYPAFGKDVVAPLEGVVVSVENDMEDNTPGVDTNTEQPLGNHVIIKHENSEFSVLGHFKKGSIIVEDGQKVKSGELLGLAGNSGNSTEPHIHYHVADSAEWEEATSIRIKLSVEEPVRGEIVEGF
ncbi:peptidoglycan DD-metalloendopeptidase family protein [Oceanobacillus manasiensis]|uniref:peptidoglycan DD-metalloendopeptidase family protein n=1 Tax=Oceanobacillus manasiensis TaxID=586413 RepID=UPI0009FE1F38|nr:peptidoglycan DD-metalloendopeptidase family protein [Oceanobacillus manasiensis]